MMCDSPCFDPPGSARPPAQQAVLPAGGLRSLHPAAAQWLRLTLEPELSPAVLRRLLALAAGDPAGVPALPLSALQAIAGPALADALTRPPSANVAAAVEAALAWAGRDGNTVMVMADPDYPEGLRELHDPPPVLYIRGDPAQVSRRSVAVVGARRATPAGRALAHAFARGLAAQGWSVVSGLALGIDGAAHEGALAAGPDGGGTLAVMATGADRLYPARHRGLASRILTQGALVTELPLGTSSAPFQFPRRNRLVAGLVRGVLVVEAAERSGSLITARLAADAGRDVFAVPGSVQAPLARGCHALIRDGARLTASLEDVLEELEGPGFVLRPSRTVVAPGGMPGGSSPASAQGSSGGSEASAETQGRDDAEWRLVCEALGYEPMDTETLLRHTGLTSPVLSTVLSRLELAGQLARTPDGRLQRISCRAGP